MGGRSAGARGKGANRSEEKRDVFENGIGQDVPAQEADPQGSVPQIGDGVAAFLDFLYIRLEDRKNRTVFFLLLEGVGGEAPLQEAEEPPRLFLGKPGVRESRDSYDELSPGRGIRGLSSRRGRSCQNKEKGDGACQRNECFPEHAYNYIPFSANPPRRLLKAALSPATSGAYPTSGRDRTNPERVRKCENPECVLFFYDRPQGTWESAMNAASSGSRSPVRSVVLHILSNSSFRRNKSSGFTR